MQKALLKSLEQPREAPPPPPPAPKPAAPSPRPTPAPVQQTPGLDAGGLALKLEEPAQQAEKEAEEGAPRKGMRKGKRARPHKALIAGLALVMLPVAGWFGWPAAKSVFMPTVAIHLGVLRHAEQGGAFVLRQGDSLLPGDRMAVFVMPKDTTYVYVLRVTTSGEVAKLFPNPAVTPHENPVLAGTELWLPAPNSVRGWFSLHDKAGQSEVIVIATAEPLRRLNDPIAILSLLGRVGPETDEKLLGNVQQLQSKLPVAQHRGTHPAPGSSFTTPTHLMEGNGQGLYYRFQLNQL